MTLQLKIFITYFLILFYSCTPKYKVTREVVAERIQKETGFTISGAGMNNPDAMPPNVLTNDGIDETEAVSIALWHNPQMQSDLATIAIAHADVLDASMVSNPLLRYLAPSGKIMASGYINFAFDFLFQRPLRIKAAQTESLRVSEIAVQRAYAFIRDVQNAYTDYLFSIERAFILSENARVRKEMAELTNSRFRNGDISELEVTTFRSDSAAAQDDLIKASLDTIIRKNLLNTMLGFSPDTSVLYQPATIVSDSPSILRPSYLQLALNYQPELKAAQINIEAIGRRLGWERSRLLAFIGVLNFQHIEGEGGSKWLPNAINPGIQVELPLLNRNQGKIARAKAELEQAVFQYSSIQQRIAMEASNNYNRFEQAWKSYQTWNNGTIPALSEAVRLSQSSYRNGDISYLPVLEAIRQLLNAQLRQAEIKTEIRRVVANLNFYLGNQWNQ